ncbi:MAG TPA: SCO1664 family protein [Natronosporangium sp.]|nr:SCO1664 family protein [Natronosporangium sp.]
MTGASDTRATHPPLAVLTHGDLEVEGRLVAASNTTVRCVASLDGVAVRCVYKPVAGERPLWDFPDGTLAGREVAAYLLSGATGWDLVPPTVLRDGPFGPGACQLWIDESDDEPLVGFVPESKLPAGWHPVLAAEDDEGTRYTLAHADDVRLARLAVFDAVANNADRKGGHVLTGPGGRVYGVDHGVCFHVEPKLRTVLWGFAGAPLPEGAADVLERLEREIDGCLGRALAAHLTAEEIAAVRDRAARLRRRGRLPLPDPRRPTVPWPPM